MKKIIRNLDFRSLIITIGLVYILLYITPWGFVDDLIEIKKLDHQSLLNLIISTTGTIFGIFFALVIFSTDLTKQRVGKHNLNLLISKSRIIELGVLLISTIIIAFITKLLVKEIQSNNELNLIYYSIILFVITIIMVLPFSISFLKNISSDKFILDAVNESSLIENSDLITDNAFYYIKTGDYQNLRIVLKLVNKKTLEASTTEQETTKNIQVLIEIFDKIIEECIFCNRVYYLDEIWKHYFLLNSYLLTKGILANALMDYFIRSFIRKYSEKNILNNLNVGLSYISQNIRQLLENNCPKEESIFSLQSKYKRGIRIDDFDLSFDRKWNRLLNQNTFFEEILNCAIDHRNKKIFIDYLNQIDFLLIDIFKLKKDDQLGELQEMELVMKSIEQRLKFSLKFVVNGIITKADNLKNLFYYPVTIELNDKPYYEKIMNKYANFIYECSLTSKINMEVIYSDWFNISLFHCNKFDNSQLHKKLIQTNISLVITTKKSLEERTSKIDRINYNSLYQNFLNLKDNLGEEHDSYIKKLIADGLKLFKPLSDDELNEISSVFD